MRFTNVFLKHVFLKDVFYKRVFDNAFLETRFQKQKIAYLHTFWRFPNGFPEFWKSPQLYTLFGWIDWMKKRKFCIMGSDRENLFILHFRRDISDEKTFLFWTKNLFSDKLLLFW